MRKNLTKILGVALPVVLVLALAVGFVPALQSSTAEAAGLQSMRFSQLTLPKFGAAGKYVLTPRTNLGAVAVSPNGATLFVADDSSVAIASAVTGYTTGNVSASATSINATSTAGFRYSGVIAIGSELIKYSSLTASHFVGCTRGYGGTTAALHLNTTAAITQRNMLYKSGDGGYNWSLTGFTEKAFPTDNTTIVAVKVSPEYLTDGILFVATGSSVYQSSDGGSKFRVIGDTTDGWAGETITDMDIALDERGRLSQIISTTAALYAGDVYVRCPSTTGGDWQAQTIGASNALSAAFSPNFSYDEGIVAVTVDATNTRIMSAYGYTEDGGGWAGSIGTATFVADNGSAVVATRARIAFPDDFDVDSLGSNIAFVGLSVGPDNSLTEDGDAFKVTFATGSTSPIPENLDVRGVVGSFTPTATNIYSIDVIGDAEAATVLVGTNIWSVSPAEGTYYWSAYISNDSGDSWQSAHSKSPTGGEDAAWKTAGGLMTPLTNGTSAAVNVVLSPDFATDGVAFAATSGTATSGFSRTADSGKSWNQISLIDYYDLWLSAAGILDTYTVTSLDADIMYDSTGILRMVTATQSTAAALNWAMVGGSVWETTNGGANYERIWSYANPNVEGTISAVQKIGDTVFVIDKYGNKFWRSSDGGATFPRFIRPKAVVAGLGTGAMFAYTILDENTIWTYHTDGAVWFTENLGRPWNKPEESIITQTPLQRIAIGTDIILLAGAGGSVYFSGDSGTTFTQTVGLSDPGAGDPVLLAVDENYAENHFIYASSIAVGGGIWRIELDEDDPESGTWRRIDLNSAATALAKPSVLIPFGGVFYAYDGAAVDTTASTTADPTPKVGGLWRSLNPAADIDSVDYPVLTSINTGLVAGDAMSYAGFAIMPTTLFMWNSRYAAASPLAGIYITQDSEKQIMAYSDTMAAAPALLGPEDAATEQGISLNTEDLTYTVLLTWSATTGATQYEWRIYNDAELTSLAFGGDVSAGNQSGITQGTQARVDDLMPGRTYYWRVRVTLPSVSPWAAARSFSMSEVEEAAVPFAVESPAAGATNVPTQPAFVWAKVKDATGYEIVVSEDKTFAIIDWSHTADQNFYQGDEVLAYSTTYYWRVRATGGEWTYGVFTTEAEPVEPTPPVVIEPTPPPPAAEVTVVEVPVAPAIPNYLLWVIVGVGAVLFIALIVLILRTRRVT